MHEPGDVLLFALSGLKRWSWNAFKKAFDGVRESGASQLDTPERLSSFARWRCATVLDSLGHCDFTFNEGSGQLVSAPAIIANLPVAGLPRAVLCGARSPETLPSLLRRADTFAGTVRVTSISQQTLRYGAPTRIEIEANDISEMVSFAEQLGIHVAPVPPAWSLALRFGDTECVNDFETPWFRN